MKSKRFLATEGSTGVLGFCAPILTADEESSGWPFVIRDGAAVLRSLCGRVSVALGDASRKFFTCACNVFHTNTIKRASEEMTI